MDLFDTLANSLLQGIVVIFGKYVKHYAGKGQSEKGIEFDGQHNIAP